MLRLIFVLGLISFTAQAVEIRYVDYSQVLKKNNWVFDGTDKISPELIKVENIVPESLSGDHLFDEKDFVVCVEDCKKPDPFFVKNDQIISSELDDKTILELTNVYYHTKKFLRFVENNYGLKIKKKLEIIVNSRVNEFDMVEFNNAFYDPWTNRVMFLRNKNKILKKFNRSGYDPSVISHEMTHALLFSYLPHPINNPKYFVANHEGIADFLAATYLETTKLGLVMRRGKGEDIGSFKRDDKSLKVISKNHYDPHHMGDAVSYVLYKSAQLFDDKDQFNKQFANAIKSLNHQYFYKSILADVLLPKLLESVPKYNLAALESLWSTVYDKRMILLNPEIDLSSLNFGDVRLVEFGYPERIDYSIFRVKLMDITVIKIVAKSSIYYLVKNSDEILGIYDHEESLITTLNQELKNLLLCIDMDSFTCGFMKY